MTNEVVPKKFLSGELFDTIVDLTIPKFQIKHVKERPAENQVTPERLMELSFAYAPEPSPLVLATKQ